MSHLVQRSIAFHQASAATALAAAYAATNTIQQARPANTMRLRVTLAWAVAPTSVQIVVDWSTNSTDWTRCSAVNSVVAGTVDIDDGVWEPSVAAPGTHEVFVSIPPGADLRVSAKMVDAGASDPTMLAWATLTDE